MRARLRLSAPYVLLFAAGLALYAATLNADVQPADSGEFQAAAFGLGIPHPPGYPLFTLLAWLFAHLPLGSPFAGMSLLSAVASSGTLVLVAACARALAAPDVPAASSGSAHAGGFNVWSVLPFLAAMVLATSTTFWAQATTTNIRSLTGLFTALMALVALHPRGTPAGFAAALGLAVGHHASLGFPGAVLGLYVLIRTVRAGGVRALASSAPPAMLVFALTQLVWLYLPWRDAAGARFAPGDLSTLAGLLHHVFARGFEGDLFYFVRSEPALFWDRLGLLPGQLQFQFSPPVLAVLTLAVLGLAWRRPRAGLVLLGAAGLHLFVTLTYRAPQTVEYALPAWVLLCIVLGAGLAALAVDAPTRAARPVALAAAAVLAVAVAGDGLARGASYVALARDPSVRAWATGTLESAAPAGTVLAQWHAATPMWALQDIEGLRRDVRVLYVPPAGAQPYAETFAERAAQALAQGPVYATSVFEPEYSRQGLCAIPLPAVPAWRLSACPQPGGQAPAAVFDNRLGVLGVDIAPTAARLGSAVDVILTATASGPVQDGDAISVRIMRPDGRLGANVDFRLDPSMQPGEVRAWRKQMGLPPGTLAPGAQSVVVGAYRGAQAFTDRSGAPYVAVAALTGQASLPPPAGIVFADQMSLIGARAWREGARLVVDLDWLALRPLQHDYVVSVRVEGGGQYRAQDGVPALGAVPTLKWIAGSRVTDRHVLDAGAVSGPLRGSVVVYDSASRIELPIVAGHEEGAPMFVVP